MIVIPVEPKKISVTRLLVNACVNRDLLDVVVTSVMPTTLDTLTVKSVNVTRPELFLQLVLNLLVNVSVNPTSLALNVIAVPLVSTSTLTVLIVNVIP